MSDNTDQYMWRPATDDEINTYYREEFPDKVPQLPEWITYDGPKEYALAFRERYPVNADSGGDVPPKDFIRRHTRGDRIGDTLFADTDHLVSFFESPADNDPLRQVDGANTWLEDPSVSDADRPVTAAVYYALDHHNRFWVLGFDIDAKDVAKEDLSSSNDPDTVSKEDLAQAGIVEAPPEPVKHPDGTMHSYYYTFEHVRQSLEYGFELGDWLRNVVGFDEIRVFYSGQGCHVYAFKDDPYYKFTYQTRRFLVTYIIEQLGIPVDGPVSWDQSRVMRVPWSLHSDVSRVVTEIQSPDFDFISEPVPDTLS